MVFFALSLAILGSLALIVFSGNVRWALMWSGPIGVVLGLWLLAPMILRAHQLYPQRPTEWIATFAILSGLFLVIAVLLALFASWPLAAAEWVPRWRFQDPRLAVVAWTVAVLPFGYLGLAAVLEWSLFSRLSMPENGLTVAGVVALIVVTCALAYRWLRKRPSLRTSSMVYATAVLASAGLVRLFLDVRPLGLRVLPDPPRLILATSVEKVRPLLVIGLDGGDWRVLRPLIQQGTVPTFARLAAEGVQGRVEALWPPYWSTPAWASVVTGYHRDQLGVHENLGATAAGLPPFELPLTLSLLMNPVLLFDQTMLRAGLIDAAPADRRWLRRPPVWERVTDAGVKTGVVFFPFTYPAVGQAAYVVSNRTVADLWEMMGVQPGQRDQLVSPETKAHEILGSLEGPVDNDALVRRLLPEAGRPSPPDALVDPTEVLQKALDVGERMFSVTEQLVSADPDLRMVVLYVGDFDSVCHAFWPYRFPDDYPRDRPRPEDVTALGPVIDRYLTHLDDRIGRLIAAFPTPPNVLIVADHGFEPSRMTTLWRAWHSRYGLFVAGGPDVRRTDEFVDVSYFDVAPTILDLLGFDPAQDLRGRSVLRH